MAKRDDLLFYVAVCEKHGMANAAPNAICKGQNDLRLSVGRAEIIEVCCYPELCRIGLMTKREVRNLRHISGRATTNCGGTESG